MFPDLTRDEVFMIGTRRLWLRWPRLADAERMATINGHPDVASRTASWPVGCDADFARMRITTARQRNAAGVALTFVMAERAQWDRAIGLIGISVVDDGQGGTLGYGVDPHCWGRGYASEALGGLISMTRLLTRIEVVRAGVMPHNPASVRVLEKNGFIATGNGVFNSPLKGAIEVIDFERRLRPAARAMPANVDAPAVARAVA